MKKRILALLAILGLLLFLQPGPSTTQADFSYLGSLEVAESNIDFAQKQRQTATLRVAKHEEFQPNYACVSVNNPQVSSMQTELPLGQFCYRDGKGFYKYGGRFWQNGAKIDLAASTRRETASETIYEFTWYYPRIWNLTSTTLPPNEVSAIFYDNTTAQYGTAGGGQAAFVLNNLPPVVMAQNVQSTVVGPDTPLHLTYTLLAENPEEQDRLLVYFNRKTDTPIGLIEWRAGKGFRLIGKPATSGNEHIANVIGTRTVSGSQIVYDIVVEYKDTAPSATVETSTLFQARTYTETGAADSDKTDNYSSGWIKTGLDWEFVNDTNSVPDPEPEPQPEPTIGLASFCDATFLDLDCEAFVSPVVRTEPTGGGSTFYVNNTVTGDPAQPLGSPGNPFKTIFEAEQAKQPGQSSDPLLEPGSVVRVAAGTYPGCSLDFGCFELELKNPGISWLAEGEVVIEPTSTQYKRGVQVLGSDITLSGFKIAGFNGSGVVLSWGTDPTAGANGVLLDNLTIELAKDAQYADGIGIYGYHEGVTIQNTSITGGFQGITCAGNEIEIDDGNGGTERVRTHCNNMFIDNVTIDNRNDSTSSGADAIGIGNGKNYIVARSHIGKTGADGVDIKGENGLVINTIVDGVDRNGIKLWRNGDVINSIVRNSSLDADGSIIFGSEELSGYTYRMLNSVVTGDLGSGYIMVMYGQTNGQKLSIINSVFQNNSRGIFVEGDNDFELINNLMEPGTGNGLIWSGDSANLLVNENLPLGGALVDAGIALTEAFPSFDLAGNARVIGAGVDLGAYEANE